MIDLNTEQLQTVVQIARSANAAITDAASLLNSVVIHNDWQCPERSEINQNTSRNRSAALTLQSDAERLYNNICYATERFLAAEQELSNSFNAVDSPIASFLSKVPNMFGSATTVNEPIGSATSEAFSNTAWNIAQQVGGGMANTMKKTVDVVSFENISDAFQGK